MVGSLSLARSLYVFRFLSRANKAHTAPGHKLVKPDRTQHGSCAVVGSAPDLLGSGFGESIEAHDLVVRINYATSKGEKYYRFRAKLERLKQI